MTFPLTLVLSSTDTPVVLATATNSGDDAPLGAASRFLDDAIVRLAVLEGRVSPRFGKRLGEIVAALDDIASELKKAEEKAELLADTL
jgi:hypothetical protein